MSAATMQRSTTQNPEIWSRRRGGRVAAHMDRFLTNERIARARAAIDEVEEFARD
jgi:hypothetical protein